MDDDITIRRRRKQEHLDGVRALTDHQDGAWFDDVRFIPNCAPETNWDDVSIATALCGLSLPSPIIINAMTGGTAEAYEINRRLARVAKKYGIAMAVGSETAALRDPAMRHTYQVVREVYPDGVLLANVGMGTSPQDAAQAINLIGAQILQVHWNTAQEIFMREGDRQFVGALDQLAAVIQSVAVPVMAKEVGQGMAREEIGRFVSAGVHAIDVGGLGGTNFMAVEAWRQGRRLDHEWLSWGIPTAASLCEALTAVPDGIAVVASGGMRSGHDIAKALALGAQAVGIAGPALKLISQPDGEGQLDQFLADLEWTLKAILVLSGCRNWDQLRRRPLLVTGRLREWLQLRGLGSWLHRLARRHAEGETFGRCTRTSRP
jgi:isopentenyl-diphosphate delta-isomerase